MPHDYDLASREFQEERYAAFRAPYWYDPQSKPCEHAATARRIDVAEAASDGGYVRWKCDVAGCGREWSSFLEG